MTSTAAYMDAANRAAKAVAFWLQLTVIAASILVIYWDIKLKLVVGGGMLALTMLYIFALRRQWVAFNASASSNALGVIAGIIGIIALVQ